MSHEHEMIPLDAVRINGGTQSRAELNQATIAEYAEAVRQAVEFPPIVTFFDGASFWLADGFHRFNAHKDAGAMEISAEIRSGTQRDAILYSVGANASHGLRRTNEDKRRAVMTLLNDAEWAAWSDRDVARQCGVSHSFVAAVRSPAVAVQQQENRQASAVKAQKVESDSTPATPQVVTVTTPPPASVEEVAVAVSVELVSEVQALREQVEELQASLKESVADNEMMGRVFDANDQIKAAMDEAARQKAIADNAERTLIAKSGEFVERARAVTYWKNQAEKFQKMLKKLGVEV